MDSVHNNSQSVGMSNLLPLTFHSCQETCAKQLITVSNITRLNEDTQPFGQLLFCYPTQVLTSNIGNLIKHTYPHSTYTLAFNVSSRNVDCSLKQSKHFNTYTRSQTHGSQPCWRQKNCWRQTGFF